MADLTEREAILQRTSLSSVTLRWDPNRVEYNVAVGTDLARLLKERQNIDIRQGALDGQLSTLFEYFEIPAFYDANDLAKTYTNGVKGNWAAGEALDILLANTNCQKKTFNNEIVLIYCDKPHALVRGPYLSAEQFAVVPPKIIRKADGSRCYRPLKGACVHLATGRMHIPEGDASETMRAFVELYPLFNEQTFGYIGDVSGRKTRALDVRMGINSALDGVWQENGLVATYSDNGVFFHVEN